MILDLSRLIIWNVGTRTSGRSKYIFSWLQHGISPAKYMAKLRSEYKGYAPVRMLVIITRLSSQRRNHRCFLPFMRKPRVQPFGEIMSSLSIIYDYYHINVLLRILATHSVTTDRKCADITCVASLPHKSNVANTKIHISTVKLTLFCPYTDHRRNLAIKRNKTEVSTNLSTSPHRIFVLACSFSPFYLLGDMVTHWVSCALAPTPVQPLC